VGWEAPGYAQRNYNSVVSDYISESVYYYVKTLFFAQIEKKRFTRANQHTGTSCSFAFKLGIVPT
jgi:hypothetical protein